MLFEEAAAEYMANKSKRLRATTLEGYASAIARHLLPAWAGRDVESITHEELQAWVDNCFSGAPGAAEKAFKTLRQVLRWSIRRLGLRFFDPFSARIGLPKKPSYRPKVLEKEEARSFLRAL